MKKLILLILILMLAGCSDVGPPLPPAPPGPPNPNPPQPGCVPAPKSDAGPDQYIVLGLSMSPYATIGGAVSINGQTYSWSPVIGLSTASECVTLASPSKTTKYTLTATNACGSAVSAVTVHVLAEGVEIF